MIVEHPRGAQLESRLDFACCPSQYGSSFPCLHSWARFPFLLQCGTMSDPSDPISRLKAALEGRYAIERELGEGGVFGSKGLKGNRRSSGFGDA